MVDSPSIEQRLGRRLGRAIRGMGPSEELAALGGLAVLVSLLLPWYGAQIGSSDLVQTGTGSFSFATAALLLTVGSALFLVLEVGRGYRPPHPLSIGSLLIAAGVWGALIVIVLMSDRPHFSFRGFDAYFDLHYGIFVAFAGTSAIALAGVQRRRREQSGRASRADERDVSRP